jgi:hypothetical protein
MSSDVTSFFSFLGALFTTGSDAFDDMDKVARTAETELFDVIDTIKESSLIPPGGKSLINDVERPLEKLLNDISLQRSWARFKTILADIAILLVVGLATLIVLYLIG